MKNIFILKIGFVGLVFLLLRCAGLKPNPQLNDRHPVREVNNDKGEKYSVRTNAKFETDLLDGIETYLGVRYRWGGTTNRGMDCSGFVSTVYQETLNLDLPRRVRDMFDKGKNVAKQNLQFGDLIFFRRIENAGVSHVGIFIGNARFAHASSSAGVIISNLTESYYKKRYAGARRVYFH